MIEVRGVWKSFRRMQVRPLSWKNLLLLRLPEQERRWVLEDVSFRLERGESLGVVGKNGGGKTTLLRLMAGILSPERGHIEVAGRVAPLLALGAGFHPDLTGEENVFLNASILGISRREVRARLGEIVEFSGLRQELREPLRYYSTGMVARLGFAVAVHVRPEILLLDEVLAVGDVEFRARCHERIARLRAEGRTVVVVSHDMDAVRAHAQRVLWLQDGRKAGEGEPEAVIRSYLASYAWTG